MNKATETLVNKLHAIADSNSDLTIEERDTVREAIAWIKSFTPTKSPGCIGPGRNCSCRGHEPPQNNTTLPVAKKKVHDGYCECGEFMFDAGWCSRCGLI
jgi:hypothetical protein